MKKILISRVLPLVISMVLFTGLRPTFAQMVEGNKTLIDYLKTNNLEVGSEAVNGYTQIYYIFEGQKIFITEGAVNSNMPVTDGNEIVYRKSMAGGDQLFIYHLVTGQTIQVTSSGNNTNPRIDGKNIVWEGMVDENWQIFLFDGMKVYQITRGEVSVNVDIDGDYIIYGTKDITGTWRSVIYSISNKKSKEVTVGISSKYPKISDGKIFLGMGKGEEFTLTAEDLFVLDLLSLPATQSGVAGTGINEPSTVTIDELLQELEATQSGQPSI